MSILIIKDFIDCKISSLFFDKSNYFPWLFSPLRSSQSWLKFLGGNGKNIAVIFYISTVPIFYFCHSSLSKKISKGRLLTDCQMS